MLWDGDAQRGGGLYLPVMHPRLKGTYFPRPLWLGLLGVVRWNIPLQGRLLSL